VSRQDGPVDDGGREISVTIARPAAEVSAFARNPANLPAWAAGLAGGIEQAGGRWFADSPMGRVEVRFLSDDPGVLDHDVVLPSGETVRNPLRVLEDGAGSRVVFTLRRRPGMDDDAFAADAAAVGADLERLRALLDPR
jgi:Polyketide cyclase / dehydrase and lipid transport